MTPVAASLTDAPREVTQTLSAGHKRHNPSAHAPEPSAIANNRPEKGTPPKNGRADSAIDVPPRSHTFRAKTNATGSTPRSEKSSLKTDWVPAQEMKMLKQGRQVNISVGSPGDTYIVVEGAFVNVLAHFASYCKQKLLVEEMNHLSIPPGDKHICGFMYRYMLAGGRNCSLPDAMQFEDLKVPDLINLCLHCKFVQYDALMDKSVSRLIWKFRTATPSVADMRNINAYIPSLVEPATDAVARLLLTPLTCDLTGYTILADRDHDFGLNLSIKIMDTLCVRNAASRTHSSHISQRSDESQRNGTKHTTKAQKVLMLSKKDGSKPLFTNGGDTAMEIQTQQPARTQPEQSYVKNPRPRWPRRNRQQQQGPSEVKDVVETLNSKPTPVQAILAEISGNICRLKPMVLLEPPEDLYDEAFTSAKVKTSHSDPPIMSSKLKLPTSKATPSNEPSAEFDIKSLKRANNRKSRTARLSENATPALQPTSATQVTPRLKIELDPRAEARITQTCWNCNGTGHLSRACPAPQKPREHRTSPSASIPVITNEGAERIKALIGMTLKEVTNIKNNASMEGNPLRARSNYRRKSYGYYRERRVEMCSTGEGITTSAREAREGEMTRAGVII